MNKIVAAVAVLAWAMTLGQSALAQQEQARGNPVEFFACNWRDGKNLADLMKVGEKFKKWADNNDTGYSAWVLTPQFHSNLGFDVGWLGGWPDGKSWGKGMDGWMAGGKELAADLDKVVDCSISHEVATAVPVNAPKGPPGNGLVMFAECTMQDGVSPEAALPAHRKAADIMKGMGSKASSWVFFPGIGSGDVDFHYWQTIAFNSYADLGAATEIYINGGGWKKVMGVLGGVSRCKPATLFDAHVVRRAPSS